MRVIRHVRLDDRAWRVIQWALPAGVWAYWLYFLAHTFHTWPLRLWLGGVLAAGTVAGFFFTRWRERKDSRARAPFLVAAVPTFTGLLLGTAGGPLLLAAFGVEAAGALAAVAVHLARGRSQAR